MPPAYWVSTPLTGIPPYSLSPIPFIPTIPTFLHSPILPPYPIPPPPPPPSFSSSILVSLHLSISPPILLANRKLWGFFISGSLGGKFGGYIRAGGDFLFRDFLFSGVVTVIVAIATEEHHADKLFNSFTTNPLPGKSSSTRNFSTNLCFSGPTVGVQGGWL